MSDDRELFSLDASEDDARYAAAVLARDGIIPVTDRAGHRGALQLWRHHCRYTEPSHLAMVTKVRRLLALPRFGLDLAAGAPTRETQLAWVRSSDIMITTQPDFPYHFSVEGLAELACQLLEEQGDPRGLRMILGNDYGVTTVEGPHGLVHQVAHNGNHRTAAIRAAGFPAALVETRLRDGPWPLASNCPPTTFAYQRLLFRAGFLSDYQWLDYRAIATAERWGHLLIADKVSDALRNVSTYEQLYGRCTSWPDWLRDPEQMLSMLRLELAALKIGTPDYTSIVGQWPPTANKLATLRQRIFGPHPHLDERL